MPHHTKTTLDELREGEIKFYPRLANALHYQTGMMTELQLNESSDWVSHQYGLIVTIFLTGVINRQVRVSQSVSHHPAMRSRSQWRLMIKEDMVIVTYSSPKLILKVVSLWLQLHVRIEVNPPEYA